MLKMSLTNKLINQSHTMFGQRLKVVILSRSTYILISSKRYKTTNMDYQYLQRSEIPMLHFQPSLPRLPIPLLERTCDRYLAALRPLLIDEAYRKTEESVIKFRSTSGPELQRLLKEKDAANKQTSYISEPWFNMYLCDRAPLPINYNPLIIMKHNSNPEYNDQLVQSANVIISSLRFMKSLRAEYLKPEVYHLNPKKSDTDLFRKIIKLTPSSLSTYVAYAFKAFPLDMSQYQGLFGATRIPETDKDRIYRNTKSRHLLIIYNGNFYSVDVLDENNDIVEPKEILNRLKYLMALNEMPNENSIGVFTSENRNKWATMRHYLAKIGNEKALKTIDSALFCLCLDNDIITNRQYPLEMVKNFLYGNPENRWFDKSLSVLVAKDGTTGVNFEHSWGDGVAVLRYFNDVHQEVTAKPFIHPDINYSAGNTNEGDHVRKIDLIIDDKVKQGLDEAKQNHKNASSSIDMQMLQFKGLGKRICKQNSISPDSIMQLGFQLAFYKLEGKFVATYESCSTAAFRHGRTETMRPCTMATKEFCDTFTNKDKLSKTNSDLRALINNCSKVHGALTKDAAMGQGFDRHLFGLRHICETHNLPKPCIFEDASYALINNNILSTSTLSSPAVMAGAFGPVVPNGFGIGYNIQDNELGSIVTNNKNNRNGPDFVAALEESYEDIKNILTIK